MREPNEEQTIEAEIDGHNVRNQLLRGVFLATGGDEKTDLTIDLFFDCSSGPSARCVPPAGAP